MKSYYKYLPGDFIKFDFDGGGNIMEGIIVGYFFGDLAEMPAAYNNDEVYYVIAIKSISSLISIPYKYLLRNVKYHTRNSRISYPNNNLCSECIVGKTLPESCEWCGNYGNKAADKYFYLGDKVNIKIFNSKSIFVSGQIRGVSIKSGRFSYSLGYSYIDAILSMAKESYTSIYARDEIFEALELMEASGFTSDDFSYYQVDCSCERNPKSPKLSYGCKYRPIDLERINLYLRKGYTTNPKCNICKCCIFVCTDCIIKNLI